MILGGKPELISHTQELLSTVARQYQEEEKQSRSTPSPLPELHFFYEGPEVSSCVPASHSTQSFVICSLFVVHLLEA